MSRVCLFSLAALLACARAYEDAAKKLVRIVDDENAATEVIGELGNPLRVPCLESEDPTLFVFWYRGHGKGKLLKNNGVYGMTRNALLIRSLAIDTLGPYTCQAYNSADMKPPRIFVVRAYMPDGTSPSASNWLLRRGTGAPSTGTQPPTSTETSTTTEAPGLGFTETSTGGGLTERTENTTGDHTPSANNEGTTVSSETSTGGGLTERTENTTGDHTPSTNNEGTTVSSEIVVPAKCTNNPLFAFCNTIVRNKRCWQKYYSKWCCKSCVEDGQLNPQDVEHQEDL